MECEYKGGMSSMENLSQFWELLPAFEPILLNGYLCRYEKMLIHGPGKSCKTTLAIQLAIAVAEGIDWLGNQATKSKVLFINMNSSRNNCLSKFKKIYLELGIEPLNISNIEIISLREGGFTSLKNLIPDEANYRLIVFDSIDDIENEDRVLKEIDIINYELGTCFVATSTMIKKEDIYFNKFDTVLSFLFHSLSEVRGTLWQYTKTSKTFKYEGNRLFEFRYPIVTKSIHKLPTKGSGNKNWVDITKQINEKRSEKTKSELEKVFDELSINEEPVSVLDISVKIGITRGAIYKRVKKHEKFFISDGMVHKRSVTTLGK